MLRHGTQPQRKVPQGCIVAAVLLQAVSRNADSVRLSPGTQLLVQSHENVVPKENTNLSRTPHTKQLRKQFIFYPKK